MLWIEKTTAKIKRRLDIDDSDATCDNLIKDYIDDVLREIVEYTNSNGYNTCYDNTLIRCVVALWRKRGVEGSTSRSAGGISDTYLSDDEISSLITSLPQIMRPIGYTYSKTRFDYPKED